MHVTKCAWRSLYDAKNNNVVSDLGHQVTKLKCSLDPAKRGFYRAANSIFGKVGRIASEEVVIHLIRTKSVPILLYGLEALPLSNSQLASLDFVVNRFFVKLFKTTDMQVARMCREHFDFVLPSLQLDRRRRSFVGSTVTTDLVKFVFAWCFICRKLLQWSGELKFLKTKF